jgi:3'(2'), 5'-bisphosphate nucleotidase
MPSTPAACGPFAGELDFAIEAVREASLLIRSIQQALAPAALAKKDRSPVTVADFAAQAVVARRLADAFPAAALVGEENAAALREEAQRSTLDQIVHFVAGRFSDATTEGVCSWIDRGTCEPPEAFWTLDPVDGTKGFLRGEQYAVALAYIQGGRVQLGVLGCPELEDGVRPVKGGAGSILAAVRGCGAWVTGLAGEVPGPLGLPEEGVAGWRRLQVSSIAAVADVRLLRSVEAGHTDADGIGRLVDALAIEAPPVPLDSQAKYAVLAGGGGDALLRLISPKMPDYRERIWDQAAGSIVVEEAGGRVSDLDGKPLDFSQGRTLASNRGVLASNGLVHEALLAGLAEIGA